LSRFEETAERQRSVSVRVDRMTSEQVAEERLKYLVQNDEKSGKNVTPATSADGRAYYVSSSTNDKTNYRTYVVYASIGEWVLCVRAYGNLDENEQNLTPLALEFFERLVRLYGSWQPNTEATLSH
jgi:hypothetical protein